MAFLLSQGSNPTQDVQEDNMNNALPAAPSGFRWPNSLMEWVLVAIGVACFAAVIVALVTGGPVAALAVAGQSVALIAV